MAEPSRLEALRRRVHDDPASVAFAALAEEYRRAGRMADAITTCRAGLVHHPGYVSARVTLGRALAETGEFDDAYDELELVLQVAPENLAALKTVADLHQRRGRPELAIVRYREALLLAPNDAEARQRLAALEEPSPPEIFGEVERVDELVAPSEVESTTASLPEPVPLRVVPAAADRPMAPAGEARALEPPASHGALALAPSPDDEPAEAVESAPDAEVGRVLIALADLLERVERARVRRGDEPVPAADSHATLADEAPER